jgi:hypothetical protein
MRDPLNVLVIEDDAVTRQIFVSDARSRWVRVFVAGCERYRRGDRSLILVGTVSERPDDLRKILEVGPKC